MNSDITNRQPPLANIWTFCIQLLPSAPASAAIIHRHSITFQAEQTNKPTFPPLDALSFRHLLNREGSTVTTRVEERWHRMSTTKAIGDDGRRAECENFSLSMKKFVCLTVDTCHVFYFVSEKADFWVLQQKKFVCKQKKS